MSGDLRAAFLRLWGWYMRVVVPWIILLSVLYLAAWLLGLTR